MKSSFPEISICISVYNGEHYLRRCLDSVCNQTVEKKEIIIVDDGSTDHTSDIIEEYSKQFLNICSIRQRNRGLSWARYESVRLATGKYIGFVDADDYIEPVMYQEMLHAAEETSADIIECRVEANGYISPDFCEGIYSMSNILDGYLSMKIRLQTAMWSRIYKRELFRENVFFLEDGATQEDFFATPILFARSKKYYMMGENHVYYHYNVSNSLSDSKIHNQPTVEQYHRRLFLANARGHFLRSTGRYDLLDAESFHIWTGCSWYQILRVGTRAGLPYESCLQDVRKIAGIQQNEVEEDVLTYVKAYGSRSRHMICRALGIKNVMSIMKKMDR